MNDNATANPSQVGDIRATYHVNICGYDFDLYRADAEKLRDQLDTVLGPRYPTHYPYWYYRPKDWIYTNPYNPITITTPNTAY